MDEDELRIENYSKRNISQLREIKPFWAYGENIDKLLDLTQHPENDRYRIFFVNTTELVEKTEFLNFDMTQLFTGDIASDYRIMTTLERWEKGDYVDPPFLNISTVKTGKLSIPDGRHRVKLSSFLGLEKIPVAINETMELDIRKLIEIEEIK